MEKNLSLSHSEIAWSSPLKKVRSRNDNENPRALEIYAIIRIMRFYDIQQS